MLEGAVARLLNQLLGKYVVDLDTENLNVGIFSGHVQLTDLKLKPEALYELNLPIQVIAGSIGKIWLQIPWTTLWSQPIVVNIEDVHIVVGPIVTNDPFDPEKNKRLLRAAKKKTLADLDSESHILGGPASFAEHLVSNILNYLQLNITNVHVRYEDSVSCPKCLAAGLCIGNIVAEVTNSKWKPAKLDSHSDTSYYLIKVEALSCYWNWNVKEKKWDLPSQYYQWRNTMSSSLRNYSMNNQDFEFLLNPMTTKIKMTINKANKINISKLSTDIVVQDCNIQLSKNQFDSICGVLDSLSRMWISWNFLSTRPKEKILDNTKVWWKYAYHALLDQRIKPYSWSRIKLVRTHYKQYLETYKQIILNPNDTELKLDLQKFEDNLGIVNVVIARQQARLILQSRSINERNFWSMLPSPERILLCEKIGFFEEESSAVQSTHIEHFYNFRLGNLSTTLTSNCKEIMILTITQTDFSLKPNYKDGSYKWGLKVEGVILEGSSVDEHLAPILSSEHLCDSPAYIFKAEFEKMPKSTTTCNYKLNVTLDSIEFIHNKEHFEELVEFFKSETCSLIPDLLEFSSEVPMMLYQFFSSKLLDKWDLNLNIKVPYIVLPDSNSYSSAENLLVIDMGRFSINTEICQHTDIAESATQMELEEQLYSKLNIDCTDAQILFCDNSENWKDARREKDTDMHVLSKLSFSSVYAVCVAKQLKSLPSYKFNITMPSLKLNVSERKIGLLLKFFNKHSIRVQMVSDLLSDENLMKDQIIRSLGSKRLAYIQGQVSICNGYTKTKRKIENGRISKVSKEKTMLRYPRSDINEAWASAIDLPGLEDNISPNNNISVLLRFVINEFTMIYSRSSDSTDRQYLQLRLGLLVMDIALMTYGPAYQLTINNIFLTDKLHTTPSGQYLDLVHSPIQNNLDVITVLYRKVSASCPDFWTHFHGVETSLVANFGSVYLLMHQEAVHTIIKYSKYFSNKIRNQISPYMKNSIMKMASLVKNWLHKKTDTPVPPGSIKFSHSARLSDLNLTVCDADFDIVNIQLSGLEMDFLFRANERFVFRSYLSKINVEHLSDVTLYSKVLSTDEDKVFDIKYVRNAVSLRKTYDISPIKEEVTDGSFKIYLGQIHCTFLYKLIVQLQRFIINLEALPFLEKTIDLFQYAVTKATETLKASTKISLSINVCGPVLLFPQKSSSPNVMIIDTGELKVENFFKEGHSDDIENILFKLTRVTVTRGVMTLTSTLEMQETLVEPINLNLDIKSYTNRKTLQKFWDIDSIVDSIQITLGQRDLSIILAIYTDNIGEGQLIDLFPNPIKSPTDQIFSEDETVKTLEAFFCEPKQKNMIAKITIEEVELLLFFDSGELLSSPIRDLNHGLCKLSIIEIDTSFVVYTDRSLDGKLSIDIVVVEEIGPDANVHDKIILQSPADDNRNNNCHITVNKPPIVDVTFHQNKSSDKSADIIIGRLSLSLSVPFCEKLALFIIECLPKDNLEMGIINPGYEADPHHAGQKTPGSNSLTLSLRINRPELIFLVETTSNKKRYFITKTEILLDYSRHGNRLNLVTSLSGLHTLFYDLGVYSSDPYIILKQCDVEFCTCYSEDKGEKVSLTISSIYIKLCSQVVHSITDILNDIVEHFRLPDVEPSKTERRKSDRSNSDDMWLPKKLNEFVEKIVDDGLETKVSKPKTPELFLVPKFEVVVICELELTQVLLIKSTVELSIYDWSTLLNCTCELTVQANYFNDGVQQWEPVIDPVVIDERDYRPWEVLIKVFQDKALPMLDTDEYKFKPEQLKQKRACQSCATTEDEDSGEDMMYLEPINSMNSGNNRRVKTSLSTFLDDSDSENEDGAMEKLAAAISDLFTGDWNENEDSDCGHSSDGDDELDEEVAEKTKTQNVQEISSNQKKAIYVLVDSKETLNITITPKFLKVFNELLTMYSNKILSVYTDKNSINLSNDIGPKTKVELYEKLDTDVGDSTSLIHVKTYEKDDSAPNSPSKMYLQDGYDNDDSRDSLIDEKETFEMSYDFETLSSLQFPLDSISGLYEKINKYFMKIYVDNFQTIQTNCSNRNWEKLIRLQSTSSKQPYYLAAKHTIGKNGRNIVLSSPLQIRNETCFALSILYKPAVLQNLNLESVGEVTNPFESTMRIAVLEPHEHFNVPLYIAYHCKIFIQPAYAEAHCASDSGIWWQDLATDLDTPYNLLCRPKSESSLEVFSLRIILKKNLQLKNSHTHSIPNYIIYLLPPMIIYNFLPYSLEVENLTLKQLMRVEPGEKTSVYSLDLSKDQKLLVKVKYNALIWTGNLNLSTHMEEKIIVLTSDGKQTLAINVKCDREGSCNIFFYTPYWIVNKTTLPLQIKASGTNTIYNSLNEDIVLFTYKRHGKQTLNVKVYESNWSNEFGLECAGSTGLVVCRDLQRKRKYMFFLNTKLSNLCPRLTKIVTLVPSFLVANNTDKFLRFMEHNEKTDLWVDLPPFKTLVFWPETSSMQMYVKYQTSSSISQAFYISNHHRTVLRLDKEGAVTVEVTGGVNNSFRVDFNDYKVGDAPVLVKNYCADIFLKALQQDQSPATLLCPYHSFLFTWDDPTKPRIFLWKVYNNTGETGFYVDISKDGYGEQKIKAHSVNPTSSTVESSSSEDSDSSDSVRTTLNKKVRKHKITIYWLCYREGLQRILLFTQELRVYENVLKANFQERCNFECLLSFSGMGLSVFTDDNPTREHIYASVADAPAIWEVNVGHKWKTLTLELASWIEDKYRLHCKKCQLKDYIHIDFDKMFMLKPFFAELRRTYHSAVYVHYRKSNSYQYCNLRMQSVQVDNTETNSIVMNQLLEPMKESDPFFDFCVSKISLKDCEVYRYIKMGIGNFSVNMENDLIWKICELLALKRKFPEETTAAAYVKDISSLHKQITAPKILKENRTIIENLVLKSFGIQLNISNKIQISVNHKNLPLSKVLDYLFPFNISPYMPLEGVHHKISSIEEIDLYESVPKCIKELLQQICSQFLQQYYSHVLGLQVLVNSFAIQPAIETNLCEIEKMAGILLYGSRCLLGHINMSPAALEQCVVDIFANQNIENIQRFRRHGSYHKTEVVPRSITTSSRNFNTGVPNALRQLIVKNQNAGLNCDGEMFFRTTGKALLSLLTRHPEEKSNSVEVAIEALRRASILGEPIKIHQRLTRYCNRYLGLKPMSVYESMGQNLLETVANSRFTNDTYWAHASIEKIGKSIILVSLEHIIRINKCRLWGNWEVEWAIDLDDIISMSKITTTPELVFNMRQGESSNLGEQIKLTGEKEVLMWLHEKIEQAIIVSMEDKSWAVMENL